MEIFQNEIDDGLSEVLFTSASLCYASYVKPLSNDLVSTINKGDFKVLAGIQDKDLYYTQSILVTTSWNKNDDIFDKAEVWAARNTPIHKPTNIEHNEGTIVGHITSNWPITDDGIPIDQSTTVENLPDKYHILTGSVIYIGYTDKDLKDRASKLIAEIEDETKYVSMECFFKGFDYGLINKNTGEYKVMGRNNETAFLTKHLRAYGGIGEYQEHKVGRVLRQITFSGKGFVNKPANPESIIFSKNNLLFTKKNIESTIVEEKNDDFKKEGVLLSQANSKETYMSLEKEVVEMKEKIEAMADCKNAIAEAQTVASDFRAKNTELKNIVKAQEASLAEIKAELESTLSAKEEDTKKKEEQYKKMTEETMKMKAALDNMLIEKEEETKKKEEQSKKMTEEAMKMKAELDATNEILAAYKDKEVEMMKKEKKMKRMAHLIETGLDTELASTSVDKFESLDDNSFDAMAQIFAAMTMKKKAVVEKEQEAMMMKKKASEDSTITSEVLETAETEESPIDLSVGTEEVSSDVENTRADLVDFVYHRLGKKLNKGE